MVSFPLQQGESKPKRDVIPSYTMSAILLEPNPKADNIHREIMMPLLDGIVTLRIVVPRPRPMIAPKVDGHNVDAQKPLRVRPRIAGKVIKDSYVGADISFMNEELLRTNFIRITGHHTLSCRQCGVKKDDTATSHPIEERWMNVLRRHCTKHGIYEGMPLPGTCDNQQLYNDVSNKPNNDYYPALKKCTTDEERILLREIRDAALRQLGIKTRPDRYTVGPKKPSQH